MSRAPLRNAGGVFRLSNSNMPVPATNATIVNFGNDPRGFGVAGNFDGDGRDDVGVFRHGTWMIRFTDDGATFTFSFGSGT